jgi:hypothetical protein
MAPRVHVDLRSSRLVIRFVLPIHSLAHGGLRLFGALALFVVGAVCAPIAKDASAKAPPLATTVLSAEALAAPDYGAEPVTVVPQGAEVELTGEAAPGFLSVYYDGQVVWVPAQYLSLGVRPGIDTAVTVADTPLLDAPMRDAAVLEIIMEGEAVILTGASVDGFDAAEHDGSGGWINERDLSR